MRSSLALLCAGALALACFPAPGLAATATLRGIVHDPRHRPVPGAGVTLQAAASAFKLSATTGPEGSFEFTAAPVGEYTLAVTAAGFSPQTQAVVLTTGAAPVFHFELTVAGPEQHVAISAAPDVMNLENTASQTFVDREQISRYAGVDNTDSVRLITEFTPGATVVHDQLHVRGGHQVTWAMDGVPLPNTNIATNVGPQFDPKDIDSLEIERGGYSADYGDRTYGVFNVSTRTGFERNRQAELVASYGSYHSTDDQLSFGDHNQRGAYYFSLNGNRTDYGLEPPTAFNLHNRGNGAGAFTSLIFNRTPEDQLRLDGAFRQDHYQVPNDPDQQAAGVRDREREQDAFATFSWVHTLSPGLLLTVSPLFHFNRAAFEGGPRDVPTETTNRASTYAGGQAVVSAVTGGNNLRAGIYAFAQRDNTLFALAANDGSGDSFRQRVQPAGQVDAAFVDDQYKLGEWATLTGGVRLTHFAGSLQENAADPRLSAAVRLPVLHWVLRGSYSRFYQAPPLDTVSGPLAQYALQQGVGFLPLHGERDEQHEIGVAIPLYNWTADLTYFRTGARNFFDHDAIGNSNIFFPLTLQHARIAGYEAAVRSPLLLRNVHAHLVYSNQRAEGFGAVTGGLTSFSPPPSTGFYLDHDQRNTLAAGMDGSLPWRTAAALDVNYGSGFVNGNGPGHLPSYATVDLSLSKTLGESLTLRAEATNIANRRYQIDLSNTFGGSHYADPRMISVQVRYRFRY